MSYSYASPAEGRKRVCALLRPPVRRPVAEVAAEQVHVAGGVGAGGLWSAEVTPYMLEPMNALNRREIETVVFAGPARSGKTQALMDCWHGHNVICDPGDTGFFFPSQELAADYSKRRIDRMHRNSPDIGGKMAASAHADNIHLKQYQDGTLLTLAWPSQSQLAQREFRYVALSDYDAITDAGGDGSAYLLAKKRTQTAMSSGMTLVESSPRFDVMHATWRPATPHEAPPVAGGALQLYNQGTRRRWYWQCPDCGEWFEASFQRLEWPDTADLEEAAAKAQCLCPHCGTLIPHTHKNALNRKGRWLAEGQQIDTAGNISGHGKQSSIDSYWLQGPAAAFQSWESLVRNWLRAYREYEATGSEESLKATVNTDQGLPYRPRRLKQDRTANELRQRAEREDYWEKGSLPEQARVLISAIDVQKNAFVCQTVAFGVGGEWWLVDRFKILASKRIDESSGLPLPIDPAGSITDWHEITAKVLDRTYLTHGGNRIKPHLVLCDSGGEQGVTPRAYEFYRRLRAQTDEEGRSYHRRFMLVKGGSSINAPTVKETWPDSTHRKDRRQGGKGDVPVLQLNTTILKDSISADMKAENPGPGYGHIPPWIDPDVFDELLAEVRTPKGWEKIANRNEAFDLVCYCKAGLIHLGLNKWGDGWRMCPYHLDSNHRQKPQPKTPPRRSAPIPTDWSFDRR